MVIPPQGAWPMAVMLALCNNIYHQLHGYGYLLSSLYETLLTVRSHIIIIYSAPTPNASITAIGHALRERNGGAAYEHLGDG